MVAAEAAVVAGEVAVAVVEAAAAVVVVSKHAEMQIGDQWLTITGWTGGNNDPVRNSRW
jgi:NADPH-dependent curcumin reductase CurA